MHGTPASPATCGHLECKINLLPTKHGLQRALRLILPGRNIICLKHWSRTHVAMATTLRHQIEENYSENADLIDEDHSGDLDVGEVETLLAAMGITGVQSQWVLQASLRGVSKTSHQRVTDAILLHADIDETKLQIMLGRVALFGKVFRWLDIDGDGQLSLPEIMRTQRASWYDQKQTKRNLYGLTECSLLLLLRREHEQCVALTWVLLKMVVLHLLPCSTSCTRGDASLSSPRFV